MKNKSKNGITLIALIITVIILLILAGTAISISLNGNDLFNKSRSAVEQWNEKVATEETSIISYITKLDQYTSGGIVKGSIYNGKLYLLYGNGSLVCSGPAYIPEHGSYVEYDKNNEQIVSENVKDFYNGCYYITKDNKLYFIDENGNSKLMGENVKKFFSDHFTKGYFLDQNDTLFYYNGTETVEIAENVKDIIKYTANGTGYLTKDNKLYNPNGGFVLANVVEVTGHRLNSDDYDLRILTEDGLIYTCYNGSNRLYYNGYEGKKIFEESYFIDINDNLYVAKGSSASISDNRKGDFVDDNVKEGYYDGVYLYPIAYIKNDNSMYYYNRDTNVKIFIANDVKKIINLGKYITSNDSLYEFDSNGNSTLISENVKEFYSDSSYLTKDSKLHHWSGTYDNVIEYDVENKKVTTTNGIISLELEMNVSNCGPQWYQDEDGNIFLYVRGSNDQEVIA